MKQWGAVGVFLVVVLGSICPAQEAQSVRRVHGQIGPIGPGRIDFFNFHRATPLRLIPLQDLEVIDTRGRTATFREGDPATVDIVRVGDYLVVTRILVRAPEPAVRVVVVPDVPIRGRRWDITRKRDGFANFDGDITTHSDR